MSKFDEIKEIATEFICNTVMNKKNDVEVEFIIRGLQSGISKVKNDLSETTSVYEDELERYRECHTKKCDFDQLLSVMCGIDALRAELNEYTSQLRVMRKLYKALLTIRRQK